MVEQSTPTLKELSAHQEDLARLKRTAILAAVVSAGISIGSFIVALNVDNTVGHFAAEAYIFTSGISAIFAWYIASDAGRESQQTRK